MAKYGDQMQNAAKASARMIVQGLRYFLCAGLICTSAMAAEPASTIVIFDGSGSMWGKISGDRESKFNAAREALRRGLPKISTSTRVGLAAFGHRRKADCSDTEVMLLPEALDVARIMGPLEKFNPKGKGPLVAAMREAATALAPASGRASLILLHDDLDNCSQDPCAAAEDLVKANAKLAVHVISIGLSKADGQRMSCVPRITGGRHFEPQDAGTLASAIEDALQLTSLNAPPSAEPAVKSAPAVAAKAAPATIAPVEDNGSPALKLTATLGSGGPAVIVPLIWKVAKSGDPATMPPIAATRAATLALAVPPGSYVVDVQHGLVSARETVVVKAKGATNITIALPAGAVRVSAVLNKGTPPLEQAVFAIMDVPGANAAVTTVWTGGADAPPVFLPVGTWRVAGELDRARAEQLITITSGVMVDATLVFGAGRLRVRASDREGGQVVERVVFRVTEDDADSIDGRREIARSTASEPEFTLSAGTYYLSARQGQAEVRERVLVNAGDDVTRTLVLAMGRLTLQSRIVGAQTPPDSPISYTIERLDGKQVPVRTQGVMAKTELPAGQYRVTSQLGAQNVRAMRDLEIKAGAQVTVTFDLVAANVQLKLGGSNSRAAAGEVMYDVRDGQDRSIWQTIQSEPRAHLAAGRYKISAESRDRQGHIEVEIKSGETRTIEVPFDQQ